MRNLTILYFLILSFSGFAQSNEQIRVVGYVTNMDNKPLIGAKIVDTKTQKEVKTNNRGIFQIFIFPQETILTIFYQDFHSFKKEINKTELSQVQNDTLYLSIQLTERALDIQEVQVSPSKNQLVYKKPNTLVIDYDFHPEGLLLLLSSKNNYFLRLVDENNTTLSDLLIPKKPEKLYKDCFENLHLVYTDSVYQIYGGKDDLGLMKGFSIQKFTEILLPCMVAYDNSLFFKEYGLHQQSVLYYCQEKDSKQKKQVHLAVDRKKNIAVDDFYREAMASARCAAPLRGENSPDEQRYARNVERKFWFYELVLSNPVYNPLCKIRDSVFIFNHLSDSGYVYNQSGSLQRTFPIDYHYRSGWENELIVDHSGKNIYAKCVRRGLAYLLQIDSDSGEILNEYKLENHSFPEKIKIKNGVVYYFHNDSQDFYGQNLFKQQLD